MRSDKHFAISACTHFPRVDVGIISLSILLGLTFTASSNVSAANSLIVIEQAIWTDRINPDTREFGLKYEDAAPKKPLYFWMHVKGNEGALTRLEAEGKLPIRHKWFRRTLTSVNPEGVMQVVDNITVPTARVEALHKLKSEVARRTYFDWRTWSMKENIRLGQWRVSVVYADNSPVLCGTNREPCEFFIEIK